MVKVQYKNGDIKKVEPEVAENLISMFPKDWKICTEEENKKPKKRETNK